MKQDRTETLTNNIRNKNNSESKFWTRKFFFQVEKEETLKKLRGLFPFSLDGPVGRAKTTMYVPIGKSFILASKTPWLETAEWRFKTKAIVCFFGWVNAIIKPVSYTTEIVLFLWKETSPFRAWSQRN